jgi:hypothetical protein
MSPMTQNRPMSGRVPYPQFVGEAVEREYATLDKPMTAAEVGGGPDAPDEFLVSLLDQAVTAYNAVRSMRRLLDAETRGEGRHICIDVYDRHLTDLNSQQLVFEGLKKMAPMIEEQRLCPAPISSGSLAEGGKIESYLSTVVDEYQATRRIVAAGDGVPLSRLARSTPLSMTMRVSRPVPCYE